MSNTVKLHSSTVAHLRAGALAGETLDATARRLLGLPMVRVGTRGRGLTEAAQRMAALAVGETLVLPWLWEGDEFLVGQAPYVRALRRVHLATGRTFIEEPSNFSPSGGYTVTRTS